MSPRSFPDWPRWHARRPGCTPDNALDIAEIVRQLLGVGWGIDPEDLAHISPYLTEHIK
ncbi:hypothetical protein ACH5AO_29160 [Streptomyces sp. NPDC018964]|uniref:hypothetical protein n=1 Tax=unclassified Streptomyces TaxID=2593676 RepID=UPI0037B538C2